MLQKRWKMKPLVLVFLKFVYLPSMIVSMHFPRFLFFVFPFLSSSCKIFMPWPNSEKSSIIFLAPSERRIHKYLSCFSIFIRQTDNCCDTISGHLADLPHHIEPLSEVTHCLLVNTRAVHVVLKRKNMQNHKHKYNPLCKTINISTIHILVCQPFSLLIMFKANALDKS